MNIGPTVLGNQIEERMHAQGIGEQSFLKLRALIVIAPREDGGALRRCGTAEVAARRAGAT
jgi:hypothetical protein